ncbi:MAG: hypothetical protein GX951_04750 [Mollicutes bacterium]|nr:hypothetical protein [Mollicutes bacterium]
MTKKKNKTSQGPLESKTIGTYKRGKNSLWVLLFIFILFSTLVFFLPNISKYYRKYINEAFEGKPINDITKKQEQPAINYKITDKEAIVNGVVFSNFKLIDNSFYVSAKSNKEVNLTELKYYLTIYDESNKIIKWYLIKGELQPNVSKDFIINIDNSFTSFNIYSAGKDNFPNSNITEMMGSQTLVCKNEYEKITYNFIDDKLNNLNFNVLVKNNSSKFEELQLKYFNMYYKYNKTNGVTSEINIESDVILNIDFDLEKVVTDLENPIFFKKNVSSAEVNYTMLINEYICT